MIPINSGIVSRGHILGDLSDFVYGTTSAQTSDEQITQFKSIGSSFVDLAGAELAIEVHNGGFK